MIVRTYTADLTGPAVDSEGVVVSPVRRLRAWAASVDTPWGVFVFRRGSAVPAGVDVRRDGGRPERMPIRNPEAPMLGAAKAASSIGSMSAKRKRR